MRYTSRVPRFPKWTGRYKQVLESVSRKNAVKRNYPFNLELLHLADVGLGSTDGRTANNKSAYSALAMGFSSSYELEKWKTCIFSGKSDRSIQPRRP